MMAFFLGAIGILVGGGTNPSEKICDSQIDQIFPNFRGENQQYLELPAPRNSTPLVF